MKETHTHIHRIPHIKRIPALFLAILLFITSACPVSADELPAAETDSVTEVYEDESSAAESAVSEGAESTAEVPSVESETPESPEASSEEVTADTSTEPTLPEETGDTSKEESLPEEPSDDSAETTPEESSIEEVTDLPAEESLEESLPEDTSESEVLENEDPAAVDGEIQFAENDEELLTESEDAALVSAGKIIIGTNGTPVLNIILAGTTLSQIKNGANDVKYKGNTTDLTTDGKVSQQTNVEIKGRGNSTWSRSKKPFQIKFDKKQDLFGQGKAKKWILLANDLDYSQIRNDIGLTLASRNGIPGALPQGQYVEVYFNGVYEGLYYLTRKVEVGTVPLTDDKGIIVEFEHIRTPDNPCGRSVGGSWFGTKETVIDSDNMDEQQVVFDSFMASYNAFEKAVINKDWETACRYADMESFAKHFILSDFSGGQDMFGSSCYMHKNGDGDVIHAGPMWDFDISYAGRTLLLTKESTNPYRTWAYMDVRECPDSTEVVKKWAPLYEYLMNVPEFRDLVRSVYRNSVRNTLTDIVSYAEGRSSAISAARTKDLAKWHPGVSGDAEAANVRKYLTERINYFDFLYGEPASMDGIFSMKGAYANETVRVSRHSDGYYTLSNRSGAVLDVAGAKKAEGTGVQWYSYNGSDAQKWLPLKNGALISKETGFILTQKQGGGLYISRATLSGGKPSAAQTFTFQKAYPDIASAEKSAQTIVANAETAAAPVLKAYGTVLKEGSDYTITKDVSDRSVRFTVTGTGSYSGKTEIAVRIAHDDGFDSSVFYRIGSKLDRKKVLTVKGGSLARQGNVQIESFSGMLEDYWFLEKQPDGTYFIRNARSGMVVDVNGGSTRNCTNIQQYAQNGTNAQRFFIDKHSDETYEIISVNSQKAVDVAGGKTADGTNVRIYTPNSTRAQRWYIEAAGKRPAVSGSCKIVSCLGKADKAVSVKGTSLKAKANVFLWDAANSMSAEWVLTKNNDMNKTWNIRSGYSGMALDVSGAGTRAGTNVWQYPYSKDNNAQKWVLMEDLKSGSCTIFSICSGMALDVSGASNKNRANIQIYTPNGTMAQKWNLKKIG